MSRIIRQMMRAVRIAQFGGPEVLKVETQVPVPKPGQNEVLIKVGAAGVNPVDTYIRSGTYARLPDLPYTPGQDSAGVVEAVGPGVTRFKVGDRVLTMLTVSGTYAEYTTANAQYVSHLDDRLSFPEGASLGVPYYTAYKALFFRAQAKAGESVLIHGASGAVGNAAIQLGKALGLTVYGTAGTKEGVDLVRGLGADAVFNHREPGYLESIMSATGGQGVDVVLEMLANVNLQNDLTLLKFRGRVVVIGCRGSIEINPRLTMGKETSIMGVALMASSPEEWQQMHAAIGAGQHGGWITPKVAKVYPLAEAQTAQNDVINNTGTTGNLIIDPSK
ncbi:quinone oxidoreductase [Aplysia californica]|uniref:Quinone oxidoreductase n=1 Tax=Aplysia californica TaxID=6500 RepID=A0ABM1W410_APLCA|nr:quinone oxidoreductase [Aplysia californica]